MDIQNIVKVYTLELFILSTLLFWLLNTYLFINNNNFKHFNIKSKRSFDALYYTITTSGSLGNGEIYPTSDLSKIVTMIHIITNVIILVLLIL